MNLDNTTPYTKKCLICGKTINKPYYESRKSWLARKYCSQLCTNKARIGKPSWNKGIKINRNRYPRMGRFGKHKPDARKKMADALKRWRKSLTEEELKEELRKRQKKMVEICKARKLYKGTLGKKKELSAVWLGNRASYSSKHKWIQKYWSKTGICENCGKMPKPFGKRRWGTEWHSLDGKYNREDRKTWLELCKVCHDKFDKQLL